MRALVLLLLLIGCSPKGHVYKVDGLPGANYKRTIKPATVTVMVVGLFVIGSIVIPDNEVKTFIQRQKQ